MSHRFSAGITRDAGDRSIRDSLAGGGGLYKARHRQNTGGNSRRDPARQNRKCRASALVQGRSLGPAPSRLVVFTGATFNDYASFTGSTFSGNVSFSGAVFHEFADFELARFEGVVFFINTTFFEWARVRSSHLPGVERARGAAGGLEGWTMVPTLDDASRWQLVPDDAVPHEPSTSQVSLGDEVEDEGGGSEFHCITWRPADPHLSRPALRSSAILLRQVDRIAERYLCRSSWAAVICWRPWRSGPWPASGSPGTTGRRARSRSTPGRRRARR